jgi:hypothetical protein
MEVMMTAFVSDVAATDAATPKDPLAYLADPPSVSCANVQIPAPKQADRSATTSAPASVIAPKHPSAKLVRSVSIPERTIAKVNSWLRSFSAVLFGRPPIVAGQDPGAYFALLEIALEEHKPGTPDELLLLKRMVDDDWRIFTVQELQNATINATIGAQLIDELTESAIANSDQHGAIAFDEVQRLRTKRLVFAALAGDEAAIVSIEEKLGHPIGISAQIAPRLNESMPLVNSLERAIKEATGRREAYRSQLAKARAERLQRIQARKMTPDDVRASLSMVGYVELRELILKENPNHPLFQKADAVRDPAFQVSVQAPRVDAGKAQ